MRIANTQFGVVTRRQLLAAGLTCAQIKQLVGGGALETVHRGVYITSASQRCLEQRALAACLACGDGATASFRTAAALLAVSAPPDVLDVTVVHSSRQRGAFRTHRTTVIGPVHVMSRGPLFLTTPARTLVDLASCTRADELTLLTDEVLRRRLVSATALRRYVDLPSIRVFPGVGVLRGIVDDRIAFGLPESDFEGRMIELLAEYGLPRPVRQRRELATGRRVRFDLCYPEQRIIIELDGWDPHSAHEQWESDHERHNAIELADWRRLSFTWGQVNHRRSYVAVTVGEKLGLRPRGWVSSERRRAGRSRTGPG